MKPILVLGSGGQVGRALAATRYPDRPRNDIVLLDRATCDVTDAFAIAKHLRKFRPAAIINCAVFRGVDHAECAVTQSTAVNAFAPTFIAELSSAAAIPLIHLSSDYVFAGTARQPYREETMAEPQSTFGRIKLSGELGAACNPRHVIIRTSYLYGPYGRNFLKTMLAKAEVGETLRVVDDQIGTPTHTEDLARAVLTATERLIEDPSVSGTYHFAGAEPCSWFAFAKEIVAAARLDVPVQPISTAESGAVARRPAYSALDSSKFAETFGLRAAPRAQRIEETIAVLRG